MESGNDVQQGCVIWNIETQTAEQLADVMVDDGEAWSKTLTAEAEGPWANVLCSGTVGR